jgi:uncharacterized protein with PQ loop repeat
LPVFLHNSLGLTSSVLIVAVLVRKRLVSRRIVVCTGFIYVLMTVLMVASPLWGAVALSVTDLLMSMPQLRKALREDDLSGLSRSSWWLGVVSDMCWASYAVLSGHPVAASWSFVSLVFSALVVLQIESRRK